MERDLKAIFAENLKRYMKRDDRSQVDVAKAVGASASAVNDWVLAKKYPRMDKVELLSIYFGIYMRDLVEESPFNDNTTEEEHEILLLYRGANERARELAKMALVAGQNNRG